MKVIYFIYYFDNGFAYFNHTFNDLKTTDITYRYKTTSKLYDTFITQKKFRPVKELSTKNLHPSQIIPEGVKILKSLNIPREKLIYPYK